MTALTIRRKLIYSLGQSQPSYKSRVFIHGHVGGKQTQSGKIRAVWQPTDCSRGEDTSDYQAPTGYNWSSWIGLDPVLQFGGALAKVGLFPLFSQPSRGHLYFPWLALRNRIEISLKKCTANGGSGHTDGGRLATASAWIENPIKIN